MTLDVRRHFSLNVRYQFLLLYTVGQAALAAAAEDIGLALVDGALTVGEAAGLPLSRFPLERTAEAHDAVEAGTVGKVLIDVATDAPTRDRPLCGTTGERGAEGTAEFAADHAPTRCVTCSTTSATASTTIAAPETRERMRMAEGRTRSTVLAPMPTTE